MFIQANYSLLSRPCSEPLFETKTITLALLFAELLRKQDCLAKVAGSVIEYVIVNNSNNLKGSAVLVVKRLIRSRSPNIARVEKDFVTNLKL
jgi:hypothetical protein